MSYRPFSRRSCSAPRQNDADRMPPPEHVITSRPLSLPSSVIRRNVAGGSRLRRTTSAGRSGWWRTTRRASTTAPASPVARISQLNQPVDRSAQRRSTYSFHSRSPRRRRARPRRRPATPPIAAIRCQRLAIQEFHVLVGPVRRVDVGHDERRVDQQRQPAGHLTEVRRTGGIVDRGPHRPLDDSENDGELKCLGERPTPADLLDRGVAFGALRFPEHRPMMPVVRSRRRPESARTDRALTSAAGGRTLNPDDRGRWGEPWRLIRTVWCCAD